jgi:hypothetical protein
MLESLYRAGFNIADEQLDDDVRRKIMRRVHEGAEVRLLGGYAGRFRRKSFITLSFVGQPFA